MKMKKISKRVNDLLLLLAVCGAVTLTSSCSDSDDGGPTYPDLTLEKTSITIIEGEIDNVQISTGSGKYTVISTNNAIAKGSINGKAVIIEGLSVGDATLTVADSNTKQTESIAVSVSKKPDDVKDLKLEKESITIAEGESETVNIVSGNGSYKLAFDPESIAEASLRENVITITGIAVGETTLTITDSKGLTAAVMVTVTAAPVPSIYVLNSFIYSTMRFTVDAEPEDRPNVWVDWNNNGVNDDKSISEFGVELILETSNEYTVYGKVTYLGVNIQSVEEITFNNPYLKTLDISSHKLSSIDLSGLPLLEVLRISTNGSNTLKALDLTNNPKLTYLDCSAQEGITSLDLSKNTELEKFMMKSFSNLALENLDLGNASKIKSFDLWRSKVKKLNLSNMKDLVNFTLDGNSLLTDLNIDNCPQITYLSIGYGNASVVQGIDFSGYPNLESLLLHGNSLDNADFLKSIQNPEKIISLSVNSNQLTSLDVSPFTNINRIDCSLNNITGDNARKFFESLPDRTGQTRCDAFFISMMGPQGDSNSAATSAVQIATEKNWMLWMFTPGGNIPYSGVADL